MTDPKEDRGDHGMRMAGRGGVEGSDTAAVHAKWQAQPKSAEQLDVKPPVLKSSPELATEEDRVATVAGAYDRAVDHMHKAERGEAEAVVGAKTYSLAIMHEQFQLTPDSIVRDEGALSDLTEYLTEMVLKTRHVDMRSPGFDHEVARTTDPDINTIVAIRNTWELPNNEFGMPNMYQRVDWSTRDFRSN